MKNREPISTRTRFEIFKRDAFKCQYCGCTPPNVVLHVDHILAVSAGGTNERTNLITACIDCNLGKSNVPLEQVIQPIKVAQDIEREKFDQLKQFNAFLKKQRKSKDDWFKQISDVWIRMDGSDPSKFVISGERAKSVKVFLQKMTCEDIIDALEIADSRCSYGSQSNNFLKYFCGICWRKIKGD